jgi:hypothetical protein
MKRWWYSEIVRGSRLALPPARASMTFGLLYLAAEYGNWVMTRSQQDLTLFPRPNNIFQFVQPKLVTIAAMVYGVFRVAAFHPYVRRSYRNWLMTTCWRGGMPLPLGPATLTLADALVLALGMGLVWHANVDTDPLAVPFSFAATYLIAIAFTLIAEGPRRYGYAVVLGLGGVLMFGGQLAIACMLALVTYIVAWFGIRRSLARLPNFEPGIVEKASSQKASAVDRAQIRQTNVGWPFGYLCPRRSLVELPRFDAVCVAVLAGWVYFALMNFAAESFDHVKVTDLDPSMFLLLAWASCGFACLMRMIVYSSTYRPPISFLGRLATGRWIIPSYDRAFLAPVVGLVVLGSLLPRFIGNNVHPAPLELPVMVTAVLLIALVPGPSFQTWSLTCESRISAKKPQPQANVSAFSGRK